MKEIEGENTGDGAHYRLGICLSVCSRVMSHEEVTDYLALEPTWVRLIGSPLPNGMRRRPELDVHAWELWEELALPSGVADQQESEEFISGFLDRLAGVATKVRVLSEEHSVRIGLVYWAKQMPYVGLTSRQVESVAGLGAGLDYDFFLDLDDEEAHTS